MKGFIILLFITIWYCTVLGKSDISKTGNNIQPRLPDYLSKENRKTRTRKDEIDAHEARMRAEAVKRAKNTKHKSHVGPKFWDKKEHSDDLHNQKEYLIDPVLNRIETRRHSREYKFSESSDSLSRSSSRELMDWKEEWRALWQKRQEHARNMTDPGGDRVNMIAARPWGVPCGDPAQHDMPWGTCVLPAECDAEYRVYRGDYFCGRTQFVCCGVAFTTYDNYQGFDVSLADTSMQTDSAELRLKKSKSDTGHSKRREKRQRKKLRDERKRKLKKTIKKIVKEVRKILDRSYKNASKQRRKKTRIMKKFITYLKRQYKKDRETAQQIHEYNLYLVDNTLYQKLLEIKDLNSDFMTNDTFRSILLNRKMTIKSARMLMDTYPQLKELVERDLTRRVADVATPIPAVRRSGYGASRSGQAARRRRPRMPRRKYLDYDVEYGLMYS